MHEPAAMHGRSHKHFLLTPLCSTNLRGNYCEPRAVQPAGDGNVLLQCTVPVGAVGVFLSVEKGFPALRCFGVLVLLVEGLPMLANASC